MSQQSIKVDAGTGSPVDFSQTASTANYRQVVAIGDPNTDANYVNVSGGAANVVGTMVITGVQNIQGTITSSTITGSLPAGSNVIGTIRMIGSIPAGNNIIGTVGMTGFMPMSGETSTMFNGMTALTPSFSTISFSNQGNNTALLGISSKQIRVLSMSFICSTAVGLYITDGIGGAGIWATSSSTGQFASNAGIVLPYNPIGWFQTSAGNPLMFNLSTTSSVGGNFTYIAV